MFKINFNKDSNENLLKKMEYLSIVALGEYDASKLEYITNCIFNCNGNIVSMKMHPMGAEMALLALIEGNWGAIAKLETLLYNINKTTNMHIHCKRTIPAQIESDNIIYTVQVITIDKPGITNYLLSFFINQDILIGDVNVNHYLSNSASILANINFNLYIPDTIQISLLREQFAIFCEQHNLDAGLEPLRE